MFYSLVNYPGINTSEIDKFREKYDSYHKLIGAHISIIFPVSDSIGEKALVDHIESTIQKWKPFQIHMKGLKKSWDHWLFLLIQEGNKEIIKLHDELYTGILAPFLRKDIEFIPHIAIGLFADNSYDLRDPKKASFDKAKYERALLKAESLNLDYKTVIDKLALVKVNDDFSQIIESKDFFFRV